jgi:hypothetical protein
VMSRGVPKTVVVLMKLTLRVIDAATRIAQAGHGFDVLFVTAMLEE